jgi:long-subunit acyl-CoA synthetase (AMP-forming)
MLSNKASVSDLPEFSEVILLKASTAHEFRIYDQFIQKGSPISTAALSKASSSVSTHDICNLQFTSGTTGSPKAAMLTHRYVELSLEPCSLLNDISVML